MTGNDLAAQAPPVRRMERPLAGRWAAGVCAAFAARLGIDVMAVRLCAVLAAVFGPGVLIYLVLWWAIPNESS
jgi:phage shock protein PspC (stress-responsive transcriptional regulator)